MAAFYFGSDVAVDEETGRELTRAELIAIGKAERAAMAREDLEMAAADQAWDDLAMAEALADREVENREMYTMADLIHEVSGEDVNGMKSTTYRSYCEDLVDTTDAEDRKHYYKTGYLIGTLAEYQAWYAR